VTGTPPINRLSPVTTMKSGKPKRYSWTGYCQGIEDVMRSDRLNIMAKQTTRVSNIKLPDSQHTQTGKSLQTKLYGVYFQTKQEDVGITNSPTFPTLSPLFELLESHLM
jgi:hypothetical protein